MARTGDIRQQVESEAYRRGRLAVPAFGGGFLYLLSTIVISETLNGAPTVGVLQGLAPAFSGISSPPVSPRAPEVKFISHHAFPLIAGSVLAAIALGALVLVLALVLDAVVFRRPQTWPHAKRLLVAGGGTFASVSVVHQVVSAIQTHDFATGHDLSSHAVDRALTTGTANVVVEYIDLLAGLAFAAAIIIVMVNALRTGLVPRWMGILGMFTGLLLFLPIGGAELQVVPALWLVMMGVLYAGKWPGGEPPAWEAGEARPWPSGAQMRAERAAARGGGKPARATAGASGSGRELPPEPAKPVVKATSRKRRKRGGRA
ncbi:MAG TPA: hypothetical protein VGG08_04825 [Solirubrobacteraceae bacterium]|jgi:hypothetical protein